MAVQYTAIRGPDPATRREARAQISSPARESLNAKLSWQKLMLILAANFQRTDLVVTLTYRDEDLPKHREAADRRLDYLIRNLRAYRRSHGQELVYVRITEGYHSGGRLHHHLIINATDKDYSVICELWRRDGDNIDFESFGVDGAERWAKYLTKEPREKGRRYVGDRTWRTSRNVVRPVPVSEWADGELMPPPGAFVTDRTQCENCYGRFSYLMARLPERSN